jgi:hypothetical protein
MRKFYSLLLMAFVVALSAYGCGDDTPTDTNNPNPTDTTKRCDTCGTVADSLPAQPCGVATDTSVGTNGFLLTGSGYRNMKVTLSPSARNPARTVDFRYDDVSGDLIETEYTIRNRVAMAPGDSADVLLTMRIKGFASGTYRWDTGATGGGGSNNVILEITRNGVTRTWGSTVGQTIVTANPGNASPRGIFCGTVKEGSTGALMAITSGRFAAGD